MRLPIITPFLKLVDFGWKLISEFDGEEKDIHRTLDGDVEHVVLIALTKEQVKTILSSRRSADWICSLQETMQSMVEDGDLDILSAWDCTGAVTMTVNVSGYGIEATTEDQAVEIFRDLVADDWESYAGSTLDFDVEDVEAEQA